MALKIGDTVKAKGQTSYRLVGVDADAWTAEPLDFGPVVRLDAATLRDNYKVDPAEATPPPVMDDAAMAAIHQQRDRAALDVAMARMGQLFKARDGAPRSDVADARTAALQRGRPAWTPDEVIGAESTDEPTAAAGIAAEIVADERRLSDVAAGHVQVHEQVLIELRQLVQDRVNGQPV